MPKDIKSKINKDNEKFIEGVEKELRKELGVKWYTGGYKLNLPMQYVREKLDGRAISALPEAHRVMLERELVNAAKDLTPDRTLNFMLEKEAQTKLLAADAIVRSHGKNDKARHNLYEVCKGLKVEQMNKLDYELHSLDTHSNAKSRLMTLKKSGSSIDGVDCMRNISNAKAPQFLGAIEGSFEKGKISIKNLSLLTEATMNARSDDAVHARVSLLNKECHGFFGWNKNKIAAMSKAFDEKPQIGWEDKISKMSPNERALTAARLIGTYPEICNVVMEANGAEISNRKLLNAVAQIQEQALVRHKEQGNNKHGADTVMAQVEAQLVTDPKAKDVVKKVLEVNDFAKLSDYKHVDHRAAMNVVLVANYPHLCSELGKDGVNFKASTPETQSIPKLLEGMKIQGEKRMTQAQQNEGLKPLRMYEEEVKLANTQNKQAAVVLDPQNEKPFGEDVADNARGASQARSAERGGGAARVSHLEKLAERSSRESARQSQQVGRP